jgi:hypothetical protein
MLKKLLLLIVLNPIILFGQNNKTINGKIQNAKNEPIPNATIKILSNDSTGLVKAFKYANENGVFSIIVPEISKTSFKYYLQISSLGYINYNILIDSVLCSKPHVFVLQPQTKDLPEVHVKADNPITKRGDTTSFKVAAFVKGNENTIADLINRLPGLQVNEGGTISYNGKPIDAVLLEDDDLFGSNYGNLINNGSVSGIEKVEVIENYKNKAKLENNLTTGKQTVLNLKYKGLGLRNFGQATLGYAPNSNLHDARLNLTTLSKKAKAVTVGNKNTTGFLAQQLFGLQNEGDLPENKNVEYPQTIDFLRTPIGFSNIEPMNINKYRIYDNNSSLVTTNLLIKPTKKILFKNNYSFIRDNYVQNYSSISNFTGGVIPVTILQESNINKNNRFFFTEGETSFNWGEKNQTRVNYFIASSKGEHNTNGFFQANTLNQNLQNNNKQGSLLLTHVIMLPQKGFINIKYHYYSGNSTANYLFTNPLEDAGLNIKNTDKSIIQQIAYNQKVHTASANWFRQLKPFTLTINLKSSLKNITPTSNALLTQQSGAIQYFGNNYNLQQQFKIAETDFELNLNKRLKNKTQITFSNTIKHIDYTINTNNFITQKGKTFLLPSFSISAEPSNKSHVSLSGSLVANKPFIDNLNRASVFVSNNNVKTGTSEINLQSGYNISMFYLYNDLIYKKILFYTSLFYGNSPTLYNTNFTASNLYMFNTVETFNNRNNNFSASIGLDKNLVKTKSWLSLKVNYFSGVFYSNTQNLLSVNNTNSIKTELKYKTNWNKWFNINTTIAYATNAQKTSISGFQISNFSSSDWLTNTTIELRFSEKFFIDVQHDYLINNSFNQPQQTIQFIDVKCRYNINKKWHTTLLLRNMLNTDRFTTNRVSITQNTVQNFALTPFFGLLGLGYKF